MSRLIAAACRLALVLACVTAAAGGVLIALAHPFVGIVLPLWVLWRGLNRGGGTHAYGSAKVASRAEMQRGGLLQDDGVILGRCLPGPPSLAEGVGCLLDPAVPSDRAVRSFFAATYGDRDWSERLIRTRDHVHIASFSPTGGGKGVGVLIPNLLSYPGNCVVVDPKGELHRECAGHRQKHFGKRAIRLDPFEVCGPGGDRLNPYDFIDPEARDFLDQCRDFANPVIIREPGGEKQPHFNDMAELNLVALTALTCGCQEDRERRHLGTMRDIASDRDVYAQAVKMMQETDACRGVIRKLGGQIAFPAGEEQASILSTFTRQTAFLDSPAVIDHVSRSTFHPMALKQGNADLWLILPEERLVSLQRLQRLWITTVMGCLTRGGPPDESRKVLWFLEEFAHIGSMPAIEEAVTLKRGRGIRLWFIFQDTNQLKTCFGDKAATILGNIGTQQYFGINSYETSEELSKRIGDMTLGVTSVNRTRGQSRPTGPSKEPQPGSASNSTSLTHSEIARRLLKPEEILTLDKNLCLIFHKNLPVCVGRLVRFFEAGEFARRRFGFGARGTARPRRLGLAAAFLAAFTLAAGAFVTTTGLLLAGFVPRPSSALPGVGRALLAGIIPPSAMPAASAKAGPATAAAQPGIRPGRGGPAAHGPKRRRRPGPSGFLIKIQ